MIIAHNNDAEAYRLLLTQSIEELRGEADQNQSYYLKRGGINLEKDIYSIFQKNAVGTLFENQIELISGQKFPDIVAYVNDSKAFGLEVKTTNKQKWRSTGSSIGGACKTADKLKKGRLTVGQPPLLGLSLLSYFKPTSASGSQESA